MKKLISIICCVFGITLISITTSSAMFQSVSKHQIVASYEAIDDGVFSKQSENIIPDTKSEVILSDNLDPIVEKKTFIQALAEKTNELTDTSFKRWSAITIYDLRYSQWMAGAITDLFIVKEYALHLDIGYAQPIENAANSRGSVLIGTSYHLDETEWFPNVLTKLTDVIPFLPSNVAGMFKYTTLGATIGYNFDRSVKNNAGEYRFADGAIIGLYVGLQKKFE